MLIDDVCIVLALQDKNGLSALESNMKYNAMKRIKEYAQDLINQEIKTRQDYKASYIQEKDHLME